MKVAIELFAQSDIISLHCPLTPKNKYIVSDAAIARMKKGVMLVNTSRGALLDTVAIIEGLKSSAARSVNLASMFTRRKKKSFLRIVRG